MFLKGKLNQTITFENKTECNVQNIIDIKVGNWVHLLTETGEEYIINPSKVNFLICTAAFINIKE